MYGYSSDSHELIDLFRTGEEDVVTCMDAIIFDEINPIFVYGTSHNGKQGRILFRKNWSSSPIVTNIDSPATEIKFSPNSDYVVCGTISGKLYILKQISGNLQIMSERTFGVQREFPIAFNFSDDGSFFLITTILRKNYKISVTDSKKQEELEEKDSFNMSQANLVYPSSSGNSPVILGPEIEYIVSAWNDKVVLWKSLKDLETNCGVVVHGHSSHIAKLHVSHTKNFVYSLGREDNCLLEWKVDLEYIKPEEVKVKLPDKGPSMIEDTAELIKRELTFCMPLTDWENTSRDTFTAFRGSTVRELNILNYNEQEVMKEDEYHKKRVPELSMSLSHVYGIETFNRRKTVFYLHYYSVKENIRPKDSSQVGPDIEVRDLALPENYLREMLFSKYTPIPYDQKHQNCERYIAFFCSRVAVVSKKTAKSIQQKFYEGHSSRISCMAVHPSSSRP